MSQNQWHRPQPNDGKKYCQKCLDLEPPAFIEIQLMQIPGQFWPNGRPKFKPVQPGTANGHVHDPRIPAYQPQGGYQQQQPQVQGQGNYQNQIYPSAAQQPGNPYAPQPPVIAPQQQPNYQNPQYTSQPSSANFDANTAVKECPICQQSGVPGQMIFTVQEGFNPAINQAIMGIYDHNMQYPNQHSVRHVHRSMQQPPTPPGMTPPFIPAPQDQTILPQQQDPKQWEKAVEIEAMKRWRFEMIEKADTQNERLSAVIRVLDFKLSRVISALNAMIGAKLLEKNNAKIEELQPIDRVNYTQDLGKLLSLFGEASALSVTNYVNDPVIHNVLYFYKEIQPLQTAATLKQNYEQQQPTGQTQTSVENEAKLKQQQQEIEAKFGDSVDPTGEIEPDVQEPTESDKDQEFFTV